MLKGLGFTLANTTALNSVPGWRFSILKTGSRPLSCLSVRLSRPDCWAWCGPQRIWKCKIQLKCQRIVNVILHQWILKVVASKSFQNRFTQQSVQKSIYHDSVYKLAENGKFLHLLIVNWIAAVLEISQRFGLHHHSVHLNAIFLISTHLEHKCLVDPAIKAWLTLYHHTGVALGRRVITSCQDVS